MIDITIKTLDSMNHQFSVQDDMTVKKFKEQIADQVNVPAETQRLIYCGRVLVDDKKLSEYDVNGKVIHLVQRLPPSSTSDTGNSGGENRTSQSRGWRPFNQTVRLDGANGNAMYLGAMAFPADLMDTQEISLTNPVISQNRLFYCRNVLTRASNMIDALSNPNQAAESTQTQTQSQPQTQPEGEPQEQETPAPQQEQHENPVLQSVNIVNVNNIDHIYPIVAQALSEAVTRVSGNSMPPPVINIEFATRRLDPNSSTDEVSVDTPSAGSPDEILLTNSAASNDPLSSTNRGESPSAERTPFRRVAMNNSLRARTTNTTALASLIQQLRTINENFIPHLNRYHELMETDPVLENPAATQRTFNQISEIMHYMAHGYHAISDIICDFNQPPPRVLRCRPVIIQHSAVLQAGIPIQLNLGGFNHSNQRTGTAEPQAETANSNASDGSAAASNTPAPNATASNTTAPNTTAPTTEEGATASNSSAPEEQPRTSESSVPSGRRLMRELEVGFDVAHIAEIIPDAAFGSLLGGRSESRFSSATGGDPESGQAQNPILQHLLQNIYNQNFNGNPTQNNESSAPIQMQEDTIENDTNQHTNRSQNPTDESCVCADRSNTRGESNESSDFPSNSSVNPSPFLAPSQVWSSTETWPTTSTNTRSTTRPHVHISPGFQGIGGQPLFDPFLPCNSHHITRSSRRRNSTQPSEPAGSQSSSTGAASSEPASRPSTATPAASTTSTATSTPAASAIGAERARLHSGEARVRIMGRDDIFNLMIDHLVERSDRVERPERTERTERTRRGRSNRERSSDTTAVFHNRRNIQIPPISSFVRRMQSRMNYQRDQTNNLSGLASAVMDNIRLTDFWSSDSRQIMLSIRNGLTAFIETLLGGQPPNETLINTIVDSFNTDLRCAFSSYNDWLNIIRPNNTNDIDTIESFNQLNRYYIPLFIQDILNEDTNLYLEDFLNHLTEYIENAGFLIERMLHPLPFSSELLETCFVGLGSMILVCVPRMDSSTRHQIGRELRPLANALIPSTNVTERFIVKRQGAVTRPPPNSAQVRTSTSPFIEILIPGSSTQPPAPVPPPQATPPASDPTPPVATPQQPPPPAQPMEVEDPFVETEGVPTAEQIADPLPDVIIGAEQWHNHVPPDWVPIITRDRERQRRQAAQGPLSDAYLAGMPSKRRKVVSSTKPNTNLAHVISESMTTAMGAAGVSPVESVAESAGTDPNIRTAYKEQVRTTVGARVRTHPDFKPEKYPNAANLFDPK